MFASTTQAEEKRQAIIDKQNSKLLQRIVDIMTSKKKTFPVSSDTELNREVTYVGSSILSLVWIFLFFCFKLIILSLSYITLSKNKRKQNLNQWSNWTTTHVWKALWRAVGVGRNNFSFFLFLLFSSVLIPTPPPQNTPGSLTAG